MADTVLIAPQYLVPVRPGNEILRDFAVVFKGGRIYEVAPTALAMDHWPGADRIELPEHVLLPGFINMHTHSAMSLLRGFADDLDLRTWLNDHIWPAETKFVGPEFVSDGSMLAMAEMLRSGTTCFNDFYFFPDFTAELAHNVGMRACIGLPLIEQASPWADNIDEYFERGQSVIDRFADEEHLTLAWAPHAPYSVGDLTLERMAEHSLQSGISIHMHCLETDFDTEHSMKTYGIGPLQRLDRHGLLSKRLIAVHMTRLDVSVMGLLRDRGVSVVHCPQSNLKLASGICPVADLLAHGINVCIGTDGAASNNNLDLLEETRTAALLAKGMSGDPEALGAFQALELMTINAARALGLDKELGSIEAGKQADFCAFNVSNVHTQPVYDVVSQIIYAASSEQCTDIWVGGRRLMEDRRLLTMDETAVVDAARHWGDTIAQERVSRAGST